MLDIPQNVKLAAKRIAAQSGETVEAVLKRFSAAVKKTALTRDDFFRGYSDISLDIDRRLPSVLGFNPSSAI